MGAKDFRPLADYNVEETARMGLLSKRMLTICMQVGAGMFGGYLCHGTSQRMKTGSEKDSPPRCIIL